MCSGGLGFFEVSHLIFFSTLCSTIFIVSCLGLCGTCFDCNSLLFLSWAIEAVHVCMCVYVCICMRIFLILKKTSSPNENFQFCKFLFHCLLSPLLFGVAHQQCALSNGLISFSVTHFKGLPGRIQYDGVSGCRKSCLNVSTCTGEQSADSGQQH